MGTIFSVIYSIRRKIPILCQIRFPNIVLAHLLIQSLISPVQSLLQQTQSRVLYNFDACLVCCLMQAVFLYCSHIYGLDSDVGFQFEISGLKFHLLGEAFFGSQQEEMTTLSFGNLIILLFSLTLSHILLVTCPAL